MQDGSENPGAVLQKQRKELGVSRDGLARTAHISGSYLSLIECGSRLPTDEVAQGLDDALKMGGRFINDVRFTRRARAQDKIDRAGTAPRPEEVRPTDRRDLFKLGAVTAAAELSRRIAHADPDPLSLDELEAEVWRVAAIYRTTDHALLVPQLTKMWQQVEQMLETPVSAAVRQRLTLVAGQSAFYLGTLAFDTGQDPAARTFLNLANQHATDVGDPLLIGSVAAMRSSVAYFAGSGPAAARIAAEALPDAHPFTRPILAGARARGASLAGRADETHAALDDMQNNVWTGRHILPGPNPGDPAFVHAFIAVAYTNLGDGEAAEPHALAGLQLEPENHFVQVSGKLNALSQAYLRRRSPDPEQAAAMASRALDVVADHPTSTIVGRVGDRWQEMNARWPELPAVQDLGDQLRALPPAPARPAIAP